MRHHHHHLFPLCVLFLLAIATSLPFWLHTLRTQPNPEPFKVRIKNPIPKVINRTFDTVTQQTQQLAQQTQSTLQNVSQDIVQQVTALDLTPVVRALRRAISSLQTIQREIQAVPTS